VVCPELSAETKVLLDGVQKASLSAKAVATPYLVLKAGEHRVELLGPKGAVAEKKEVLEPRQVSTWVCPAAKQPNWINLTDAKNTNKTKALLSFYPLVPGRGAVSLKLADGSATVFSALAYGKSASLQVNPVRADVVLVDEAQKKLTAGVLDLSRGDAFSVWVLPDKADVRLLVEKNVVEVYKK
jgi:hypothetical protein